MIQAWAPESFSQIPRGSHFYSSVERNALFFPSCSLASRSSAARSVHISPTQIKPGIVMAFCTGMLWKIRNLRTVVLTTGSTKAPRLEEHPIQGWNSLFHLICSTDIISELQVEKEQIGPVGRLREPLRQLKLCAGECGSHHPQPHWAFKVSDCWVKETSCQADWGNVHIRIPPSLPPSSYLSFTWEDPALLADSTGTNVDYFGMSTAAFFLISDVSDKGLDAL